MSMRNGGLIAGLLLCLIGTGWVVFRSDERSAQQLQSLLDQADASSREKAGGLVSYCHQFKEGVSKQFFYREELPRQLKLNSQDSQLFLFKQGKMVEIIEELDKVTCLLQEKLFYDASGAPFQMLHVLEADSANYHYNDQILVAKSAKIKKYLLPSHQLMAPPVHQAPQSQILASQLTVKLQEGHYDMQARGLTLILEDK